MNEIFPSFIDNRDYKFLVVNDKYLTSLGIFDLGANIDLFEFNKMISKENEITFSMHIKRLDTQKVLKDISTSIINTSSEIKSINKNQIDIDILNNNESEAKRLRYEIQVNNQKIFQVNLIFAVTSDNNKTVTSKIFDLKNSLFSIDVKSHILNFRHLEGYLSTIPSNSISNLIESKLGIICTTKNISIMFPFLSRFIFQKNGVLFGEIKRYNSICNIDIFNKRHINSNICIFGSSGAGKSYFVKLLIIRHSIKDVNQYIFDQEGEYYNLAKKMNAEIIDFSNNKNNTFNVFSISKNELHENFFGEKVNQISEFLINVLNIPFDYSNELRQAIIKSYKLKGINETIASVFKNEDEKNIYLNKKIKSNSEIPIIEDLINFLNSKELIDKIKALIQDNPYINCYSNADFESEIVLFDFSKLTASGVKKQIFLFIIEKIKNIYKNNEKKGLIYIDEVWKFIKQDKFIAEEIFLCYKTIRKLNLGIITITQDISDLFSYDMGNYGKSILNNSYLKIFFKTEYLDSDIIKKISILNTEEINYISKMSKGEFLLLYEKSCLSILSKSNDYENCLIGGDLNNNNCAKQ